MFYQGKARGGVLRFRIHYSWVVGDNSQMLVWFLDVPVD